MADVAFAIPGELTTPTGGYAYDREVMARLAGMGIPVRHLELPAGYPAPTPENIAETARIFSALAPETVLLVDGLAFGAMPADLLGLDLTYGPKLADRIATAGAPRTLVLGVVDGRNTKLETRDALLRTLDRALPGLRGPVGVGPSCGLELLPRDRARAKLENMVAIAREHAGRDGRPR